MKVSEINRKAIWDDIKEFAGDALGVVGSIVGGLIGSEGAGDAADAASDAAKYAADLQWKQYQQSRQDLQPWREAGQESLNELRRRMGLPYYEMVEDTGEPAGTPQQGPDLNALHYLVQMTSGLKYEVDPSGRARIVRASVNPTFPGGYIEDPGEVVQMPDGTYAPATGQTPGENALVAPDGYRYELRQGTGEGPPGYEEIPEFTESPGYQWTLDQGLKAQQNALSAMGRNRSGAHLKAAADYAEGLASTEYDNFLNRWYRDQSEKRNAYYQALNPYLALSGQGQVATENTAQLGAGAASGAGQANILAGQAQGAGYINQANALSGMITGGVNNALYAYYRNQPGSYANYTPYQTGSPNLTGQYVDQWQYARP